MRYTCIGVSFLEKKLSGCKNPLLRCCNTALIALSETSVCNENVTLLSGNARLERNVP